MNAGGRARACETNCLNKTSVPILLSVQSLTHMGVILDFSTGACLLSISVQLEEEANGQRQNFDKGQLEGVHSSGSGRGDSKSIRTAPSVSLALWRDQ